MSEPTPSSPTPAPPAPVGNVAAAPPGQVSGQPSPAVPPAATTPPEPASASPPASAAGARPEWLPEDHWDTTANAIKPEFGKHYAELKSFVDAEAARKAQLPQKAEDYKIEVKLPPEVKVPDGMELRINEKDPRVPVIRALAHEQGWTQETVNKLVALDAQMQIEARAADIARVAAEDAKLGANAKPRKEAVASFLKGMKDRGELSADEHEAVRVYATDAAAVTALEKLIAKANGSVPGHQQGNPPAPQPKTIAERMYPNGFGQTQKVS